MVTAKQVTKKFGSTLALSDINLHIEPGEFVFLTGQSGSGKSTLLKLILREVKPDSGELVVNGENLLKIKSKKLSQYRRNIGPIFQDFRILFDRSVAENIALPLQVKSVKTPEILSSVKIAAEMVGLQNQTHLFPAQLSGGEVQRVAIARAIVSKPALILADEPTGNLDPKTAKSIVKLLRDIHEELKTTIVMATHNADIVNHNALRVVTLEKGRIIRDEAKGKYE